MARSLALAAPLTVLILCALATTAADDRPRLDADRYLGAPVRVENLTVWPVHSRTPVATPPIWSLHDAQAKGAGRDS